MRGVVHDLALQVVERDPVVVDDAEVPTPAAARYISSGEPSPPAPMTSTLAALSLCWPWPPTSRSTRWRL